MNYLVAVCIATVLALQPGVNSALARRLDNNFLIAALVNFAVGTIVLAAAVLILRRPLPPVRAAASAPWWMWTGGALGAAFVLMAVIIAPRIGTMGLQAATVAGSVAAALVLDHFAVAGLPRIPINPGRLLGAALVLAGVIVVALSSSRPAV